jgi:hypothetical protein
VVWRYIFSAAIDTAIAAEACIQCYLILRPTIIALSALSALILRPTIIALSALILRPTIIALSALSAIIVDLSIK